MSNCSNHKKEVAGITDMKLLAEIIGDLNYETLNTFLDHLAVKLHNDGVKDFDSGRKNLGGALLNAALYIQKSRAYMYKACEISKPFME